MRLYLAILILGCSGAPPPADEPSHETPSDGTEEGRLTAEGADEPAPVACQGWPAEAPNERGVDGAHRRCGTDADCVPITVGCSSLACAAVHRDHIAAYEAPLECSVLEALANDCRPLASGERAVCVAGCCSSERLEDHATGEDACRAIEVVYARDACTVFGPTFSVENCLDDVAEIRGSADEAGLRRLSIGLDCASVVTTCAQIERCVREFRSPREEQ